MQCLLQRPCKLAWGLSSGAWGRPAVSPSAAKHGGDLQCLLTQRQGVGTTCSVSLSGKAWRRPAVSTSATERGDDLQCLPQWQSMRETCSVYFSDRAWGRPAVSPSVAEHEGDLQGQPRWQSVGETCSVSLSGKAWGSVSLSGKVSGRSPSPARYGRDAALLSSCTCEGVLPSITIAACAPGSITITQIQPLGGCETSQWIRVNFQQVSYLMVSEYR